MNIAEAGNTFGITVDLTIQLVYEIKLNIDYSDETVINYWQGIKDNKIFSVDFPTKLLGFATILQNEPDGVYYENDSFEEKAINHAKSLGYRVENRDDDYKATKKHSPIESVYGFTPLSLLSMIQIAENYGNQWQQFINTENYDAIIEESIFEMPIEDFLYINGRGFALTGKIKEGRVYRGTYIRIVGADGQTKISDIRVDDLAAFGYIIYAEKGDNIGLYTSSYPIDVNKKIYTFEKGDIVLYGNVPVNS